LVISLLGESYWRLLDRMRNPFKGLFQDPKTLYKMMLEKAPPMPTEPGIYLAVTNNPGEIMGPLHEPMIVMVGEEGYDFLGIHLDGSYGVYEDPDRLRYEINEFRKLDLELFKKIWEMTAK